MKSVSRSGTSAIQLSQHASHFPKMKCQLPNSFTWWSCICVYQPLYTHRRSSSPQQLCAPTGYLALFFHLCNGDPVHEPETYSTVKGIYMCLPYIDTITEIKRKEGNNLRKKI